MIKWNKSVYGIKNPHIIHFLDDDGFYLCIKACYPTKKKSTRDWGKVTCKNCLQNGGVFEIHKKKQELIKG